MTPVGFIVLKNTVKENSTEQSMKKRTRSVQISMICWTKRSWRQTASSEGKLDGDCLLISTNTTENKLNSTDDKV